MRCVRSVKLARAIGLGAFLTWAACSTASRPIVSGRMPLNLDTADQIRVGTTQGKAVQGMLGDPRIKLPGDEPEVESWLYCEREKCSQPRLVVQVDARTDVVISVSLTVKDGEPEQDLDRVRDRYPGIEL